MRGLIGRTARVAGILGTSLALGGCAAGAYYFDAQESNLIRGNYAATDVLVAGGKVSTTGGPLLVATVVDIDHLDRSSTLGRLVLRLEEMLGQSFAFHSACGLAV